MAATSGHRRSRRWRSSWSLPNGITSSGVRARTSRCARALHAYACGQPIANTCAAGRAQEWLLIEWPEGHKEPMKYWLSTLAQDMPLQRMVLQAKMRWRIERDYQDLKQDLGLGRVV